MYINFPRNFYENSFCGINTNGAIYSFGAASDIYLKSEYECHYLKKGFI